eukprot:TRINITY_DN35_c0_g4_i1.p2 TRINITY_DN35_c0_g4~~TRINITY_DN35_c0_g4_i1.p2  ORF type:complete len:484 (-),score=180.82 TRINITY_DN35_c0_g4_i1:188-1639(-)
MTCRSSSQFGLCKPQGACDTSVVSGLMIRDCAGDSGHVCCHALEISTEALADAESDGAEVEDASDSYTPQWTNGVSDLLRRHAPGAGSAEESCWENQVPYPCGQAYSRGSPLGVRQCVNIGDKRVTTELACKYKALADAARAAGHTVNLNSGFRTNDEQQALRNQNCRGSTCRPATARAGYSNHQNGIAVDISVAAYPRLFQWLRDNATRYGFIRTVSSENWHWEYRPGKKCNDRVRYTCKSPPLTAEPCDGAATVGSETEGLFCRDQSDCSRGHISGVCRGSSYCCKREPCDGAPDRTCVMPGEDTYGHDTGKCSGKFVCARHQPKCENHPEIGCVPESEATHGSYEGECPGSLVCPRPPTPCEGDASRTCQRADKCSLFGADDGLCGAAGPGMACCKTTPPLCRGESEGGRVCASTTARSCVLYKNDAGLCPGSSTCCNTGAKCAAPFQAHDCVDPETEVPAGMKHQRGKCPGGSVCLIPQ